MKLESLPSIPENDRQAYSEIAVSIFTRHKPIDPKNVRNRNDRRSSVASMQQDAAKNKEICVASGRVIRDSKWRRCATCKHPMLLAELKYRMHCPLCHSSLKEVTKEARAAAPAVEKEEGDEDPRFKNLFANI